MKCHRIICVHVLFTALFFGSCSSPESEIAITRLRCEYLHNPIGIDVFQPRLSWNMESSRRSQSQTSYQILVANDPALLDRDSGNLWNSRRTHSNNSLNVQYQGKDLKSGTKYYWKVRIWDHDSTVSSWSEVGTWFTGLLNEGDWRADWIGFDLGRSDSLNETKPWGNSMKMKTDYRPRPCSYFRFEFELEESAYMAHAFITALGIYELYINGQKVGEDYFTPGWTDYSSRVYYNTYDVSTLLKMGVNTVAVALADGWYAGNVADRGQEYYGKNPRIKAQIHATLQNGRTMSVITDSNWVASLGPIVESDMQAGETYDARLEFEGWNSNGFDDKTWGQVNVQDTNTAILEAYPSIGVQKVEEIFPSEITLLPNGNYSINFDQNFAGWVRLKVRGNPGDSIVIRFAEKLNENGSLYTRNLRSARATDTYVASGNGEEIWEPTFTYHGFQYAEISGYPGELSQGDIVGVALHSNLESTGSFTCSNPLITRLNENILWSQKSNYFDVPTDCPQRDERMGWTGDAQVFMRTASYNMNIAPFFTKWLVDVADGQFENGRFPSTAPRVYNRVAAGWGDAGVICPWNLYNLYQDTLVIRKYYPKMSGWMKHLEGRDSNYISTLGSYGDWQNVESETPIEIIATAYYKKCADLMIEMASILGLHDDSIKYAGLSENIRTAFVDSFLMDDSKVKSETQTAYLLALSFSLLPESEDSLAFENLVETIYNSDTSLTTGILGTQLLLPTLTEYGRLDLAYRILLNERFPSWGHQINNGATTIWERWDSYSEYQGFHEDSTNSLNHYAYGSVGQWFYSTIAGIRPAAPAFKEILIDPRPGGELAFAKADFQSAHGLITSNWEIDKGQYHLDVTIPVNTSAWVTIRSNDLEAVTESGQPLYKTKGVKKIVKIKGQVWINIGSGSYYFQAPL